MLILHKLDIRIGRSVYESLYSYHDWTANSPVVIALDTNYLYWGRGRQLAIFKLMVQVSIIDYVTYRPYVWTPH